MAAERLREHGPNEIEAERPVPWWETLLHQFRDPLIYILFAAAAVTLLLREFADTGVILAVVLLNALIGFVQERRAQKAMRALVQLSAPRAEVVRDGESRTIAGRELVPGDLVLLTSGSLVPADLRLVHVRDLEIDESALTGESVPVRKVTHPLESETSVPGDQVNMAFAGTIVTRGRARGFTVRTGRTTELGRIAEAVRSAGQTATPLQRHIERFGHHIGIAVLGLAVVVLVVGLIRDMAMADVFLIAVALAVSAIPEGLPVVLTVTLAIGMRRMAKRNAIVRTLPSVETLGSTTVIASDKTGTLTRNEMTVREAWAAGRAFTFTGTGYAADGEVIGQDERPIGPSGALRETLRAGVLASEADPEGLEAAPVRGDPTELALLIAAAKGAIDPKVERRLIPALDMLPFEPERRFMASLHDTDERRCVYLKGAPEAVLARCDDMLDDDGRTSPLDERDVLDAAAAMAGRGLRVLAMARRAQTGDAIREDALDSGCTLLGLQGMEDPVRPEAVEAVHDVREAGVRVLMLTGDHLGTARAIGDQLGLRAHDDNVIEGRRIETLSDAELDGLLERVDVFARVAPEHKLRVVERLLARGEVVAVTGDGVNDAPALRAAHLGVAMGATGTDVAREASDMVLADDNFATIVAAVEEGRVVFANIRKVTFFLLSTAVGEVLTIVVALLAGWPLPFLAAQILWVNLVTNGVQDVALAFEPGEPGLLRRRPRSARENILSLRLLERLGGVGLVLAAGTLFSFWWALEATGDVTTARSVALTQMVVFQFFHVFNCRSLDRSILRVPFLSNPFLFISVVVAAAAHMTVLHFGPLQTVFRTVPLDVTQWGMVVAIGATVVLAGELDKWRNRRWNRPIG